MSKDFEGRTALVTGGASGIGKASVLAFINKGANVVIADIDEEAGDKLSHEIKDKGGNSIFIRTDVTSISDVENLVNQTVKKYKRLDFAFNNAGISSKDKGAIGDITEKTWLSVIDINLNGTWRCMRYEIPVMLEQGHGVIINNASVFGHVGFKCASYYAASKHGVIGLTKTAALEYADKGLRINAICPGFVETPLLDITGIYQNKQVYDHIAGLHPMGRLGRPDEIAKTVVWMCSDDAPFMCGSSVVVDGGFLAR